MKSWIPFILFLLTMKSVTAQSLYDQYPVYTGKDLGMSPTKSGWQFKVWSPTATAAELLLFTDGQTAEPQQVVALQRGESGTWFTNLPADQGKLFYTCRVQINGKWLKDMPDPYAKAVGANGKRAQILELSSSNPEGWERDQRPQLPKKFSPVDAVIYELQIRDASIDTSSGIRHAGKYLGLAETNTRNRSGASTGLTHMKELGITHVHLLPFFDFQSIDETQLSKASYNWGYDPLHYNAPEGSFSTDPFEPATRIRELKTMIAAFHQQGLRVVMDVVYNHTGSTEGSVFNQFVPGYYYRQNAAGGFSDATACGNETASERPMMRKYMIESLLYWMREYHIDGFRFDLMGVHDIATMQIIADSLRKELPDVLLYGEGWTAGASPLREDARALKKYASKLNGIAVFGDDLRDGIKGSVFEEKDRGFASGKKENTYSVKFGIVAAGDHPQINMKKVNYSTKPFTKNPTQVIAYCECHDNHTLYDKLKISYPTADSATLKKMHLLALSIVLTSQGIPFLHAGTEFLRSKKGIENSYNHPDSINAIQWEDKTKHQDIVQQVQALIAIRKAHPAFRMRTQSDLKKNLHFLPNIDAGTIAYTLDGKAVKDSWKQILVIHNGQEHSKSIPLPTGKWKIGWGTASIKRQSAKVAAWQTVILYQK
jgi:pullulanase